MNGKPYHHGDLKNALIQAGIEILAQEGVYGLSLRKVARTAGVSHTAPYSHFSDKQGLIAAISTEGYNRILAKIEKVWQVYEQEPLKLLALSAWEYVQFGMEDPELFKITFSGVVEKEKDYPALVEAAQVSFSRLKQIVERCQAAGILPLGPTDLGAVSLWSAIHGLVILRLDSQISHSVMDRFSWEQMLIFVLNQNTLVEVPGDILQ